MAYCELGIYFASSWSTSAGYTKPEEHSFYRHDVCVLSLINHVCLFFSSYLQALDSLLFFKKALLPAFFTEFAAIPFGVVMALSFIRMGTLAFFFLGATLLFSNAVLRNLSLIRYDQEEKLRQLGALNNVNRKIISLRSEHAVLTLLFQEIGNILENNNLFLIKTDREKRKLHFFTKEMSDNSPLYQIAVEVAATKHPILVTNAKKDAPEKWKVALLKEPVRSLIAIPINAGEQTYGILGAYSKEPRAFKREHLQILTMIADEAALALENSQLYGELTDQVSELERLNKELRQLDKLKSEFLANVSHELRTPLASIKGYVEYIKEEKLGPVTFAQNEALSVAQRNILRLERLINDLLDYTKLQFKRSSLALSPCLLEEIWKEAYEQYSEWITKKKLSLHLNIAGELPLLFVDRQKFVYVLSNLISNAVKFTLEGGMIWVEANAIPHHPRFYNVETYTHNCIVEALVPIQISVRDNGIGIPAEAMPRIFDRFYQVDSSNTRRYGGTGLGLALVKSILDAHGNPIHAQSILGEGTTFTLVVPGIQAADIAGAIKTPEIESHETPKYVT